MLNNMDTDKSGTITLEELKSGIFKESMTALTLPFHQTL
jgi:Ca2+-binding EF-hand superfamily protein